MCVCACICARYLSPGGYLTKFKDSFSFLTVRNAGHEVPAYQPQKALEMLRRYLDGTLFSAEA
jgi:carboxypeptidase C (cathepsin A)